MKRTFDKQDEFQNCFLLVCYDHQVAWRPVWTGLVSDKTWTLIFFRCLPRIWTSHLARVQTQAAVKMLLKQKKQQSSWLPLQQPQCMITHQKSLFVSFGLSPSPVNSCLVSVFPLISHVQLSHYWTPFFFSFCHHKQRESDADRDTKTRLGDRLVKQLQLTFEPIVAALLKTSEVRVAGPKQHHVGSQASGQLSPLNFIQSIALAQTHI